MSTELRELLEDVAAGKITAEEASTRIHDLQKPADEPVVNDTPVARIVIRAGAVRLRVVGDPSVAEAVADGPHTVARDGDALVIATSTTGDYTVDPPRSAFMSWVGQMVNRVGATLDVRVNPDLPLQILLVGGPLDLSGVNAGASVGVEAGSAALTGSGPLLLDVSSGSGRVDWTFTGQSRVRADMGSVNVTVRPDSDVVVTADTSLGQAVVKSHTGNLKAPQDGSTPGITVGGGHGVLTVSSRMGAAQVTVA